MKKIEKFSKELHKLLLNKEFVGIHPSDLTECLWSFGLSIIYNTLKKEHRKSYCIKTFAKFLDYFEKNFEQSSEIEDSSLDVQTFFADEF
jgi:hypothetical protein